MVVLQLQPQVHIRHHSIFWQIKISLQCSMKPASHFNSLTLPSTSPLSFLLLSLCFLFLLHLLPASPSNSCYAPLPPPSKPPAVSSANSFLISKFPSLTFPLLLTSSLPLHHPSPFDTSCLLPVLIFLVISSLITFFFHLFFTATYAQSISMTPSWTCKNCTGSKRK